MHHKKRVEETRVRISLYRLLTVEPRDLISSSRYTRLSEWICKCVQKRKSEIRFFPFQPIMGLNL